MKFPLKAQEKDRLPVHRLAARALCQDLEGAGEKEGEKQRLALETSLSSGVVCSQTAYVGVNTELGQPVQGPLIHRDVPHANYFSQTACAQKFQHAQAYHARQPLTFWKRSRGEREYKSQYECAVACSTAYCTTQPLMCLKQSDSAETGSPLAAKESPLLRLVSLQNADGSWVLNFELASLLGLSKDEIMSKTPEQTPHYQRERESDK
ncbi:PREDICTED: von Willebrand factor A domain-containing protein 5A-like [Gekko japonicus]|uniref:von Willebrand factor A domain-containing protein 5A-like n=1 Tax=Gekko japonicus TaxID=146911 RepID=A0ABM1JWS2_GEKJA|nr:PREDICTED: von Willebrand factor A domain-containing protein 5A-like [Gekko japonicus]